MDLELFFLFTDWEVSPDFFAEWPKNYIKNSVGLAAHECSNFWGQQTYECNNLDLNKAIPENDLPVKRIILKFWAKALKSLLSVKFAITFIKNLDSFHIRLRSQQGIKFSKEKKSTWGNWLKLVQNWYMHIKCGLNSSLDHKPNGNILQAKNTGS